MHCIYVELTAVYVTARTAETQMTAKNELDIVRQRTDRTLASLVTWPAIEYPDVSAANMFRSPHLFAAILGGHRESVRVGVYFWDEVIYQKKIVRQTYCNIACSRQSAWLPNT
jgi:hypothetical protein